MDTISILKLPAPVLLLLALNLLAVAIRLVPKVPNWAIPFFMFGLGALAYPRMTSAANTVFASSDMWTLYVQGFILGGCSLGADSLLAKFDWYKKITNSFGDAYTQGKAQDAPKSELKDKPLGWGLRGE